MRRGFKDNYFSLSINKKSFFGEVFQGNKLFPAQKRLITVPSSGVTQVVQIRRNRCWFASLSSLFWQSVARTVTLFGARPPNRLLTMALTPIGAFELNQLMEASPRAKSPPRWSPEVVVAASPNPRRAPSAMATGAQVKAFPGGRLVHTHSLASTSTSAISTAAWAPICCWCCGRIWWPLSAMPLATCRVSALPWATARLKACVVNSSAPSRSKD